MVERELHVERGTTVLLACSGGADSTAMLHVLAGLRSVHGWNLVAHGVDHGLREGALEELDVARRVAALLDVPFEISRLVVERGPSLQARARAARYAALRSAASRRGASLVATAHTADDRAETVLLRLMRSAPAGGLAVLPPRSGDLLRPLIRARRADVELHLRRHAIAFTDDPSNRDPRFLRVRIRHEVMPLLEALAPRIVETLGALADELAPVAEQRARADALPVGHRRALERALREGRRSLVLRTDDEHELRLDLCAGTLEGRIVGVPRVRARPPQP
jgi:tRNA(Ile)-lysidine synthase